MRRFAFALLVILMPQCLTAASRLQYLPLILVQHTSKLMLELQESLPVLNLTTKGNQVLKFDLVLKKGEGKSAIVKLPISLTLTLKDLFVFLNVNGVELTFDPRGGKNSIPFMQLSQLIDKPMQLNVDEQGYLVDESETFTKFFQQLPALKDLSLELLFNDLIFHLFALCGQELTEGAKFQKKTSGSPSYSQPAYITYDIVEINDHTISATMNGSIEPTKLLFDASFPTDNQEIQKVEMILSGNLQGKISWKRSNAMLYTLNSSYHYLAELKLGDMRWTMELAISHVASSSTQ